jgi:hypothetical protein
LGRKNHLYCELLAIVYTQAAGGVEREMGVLIYIKASLSGDENDYVSAYKTGHPAFPHETTMEQLFSEEQFECYRALGEHIGRRMISGMILFPYPALKCSNCSIWQGLCFRICRSEGLFMPGWSSAVLNSM